MRRRLPLAAEVLARSHQAASEKDLPESIHRDPCRQRMTRIDQPVGEAQPITGVLIRHRKNAGRSTRFDRILPSVVGSASQHEGWPACGQFLHHHDLPDLSDQLVFIVAKLLQLSGRGLMGLIAAQLIMNQTS